MQPESQPVPPFDPLALLDAHPSPVFYLTQEGEVMFANAAAQGLFDDGMGGLHPMPAAWIAPAQVAFEMGQQTLVRGEYAGLTYDLTIVPFRHEGMISLYVQQRAENEEEDIDRLRSFYEHALDAMPAQLAIYDREGHYLYVSPSGIKDPQVRGWLQGKTDIEFGEALGLEPHIGQNRLDKLNKAAHAREVISFEESFTSRVTGHTVYFTRTIRPILGQNNEVLLLLGFGIDISEQRRAEIALQTSEERYRYLVELARDMIYQADLKGQFTYINPVGCSIMQLPQEAIIGRHFLSFIRHDHRDRLEAFYRNQVIEQIPVTYQEFPVLTNTGHEVWVGQYVQLRWEEGDVIGVHAEARDITKQKQTEAELRFQKSLLETQLEIAMDGILVISAEGEWISANQRFFEMWKIPEEHRTLEWSAEAEKWIEGQVVDPEAFSHQIRRLYADRTISSFDKISLKDDSCFVSFSSPIYDPDNQYLGRIWYYRDETAWKQVERARMISETRKEGILTSAFDYGMHDFISKPFNPTDLFNSIARLLPDGRTDLSPAPALPLEHEKEIPTSSRIDPDFFKMHVGSDPNLSGKLIELYLAQSKENLAVLQDAFAGRHADRMLFMAHKFKSSAGMIGATRLSQMLRTLEMTLEEGRAIREDFMEEIVLEAQQVAAELEGFRNSHTTTP